MYHLLQGLGVVEAASFIAAPYAGLMLSQLGADVLRIDQIGGGPDFRRWPLSSNGDSFYWEALNKGKRSMAVDLGRPEGRELVQALAAGQPGQGGVFLTNFPADGFLSDDRLRARRPDLICARVMGWPDGGQAVDYTVNATLGLPLMTGPADRPDQPVNHVLPAWDLLAGATAATSVLAAVQYRQATGHGQEIRVPLGDVAAATLGNLGQVAEVLASGADRPKMGNALFGAFGRDFVTADGVRVMVVGLTSKQWGSLVTALDLGKAAADLEATLSVSLAQDAGLRFLHRAPLEQLVETAVSARTWAALERAFQTEGVCYGRYQSLHHAVTHDAIFRQNPVFAEIANPSGAIYPVPGFPASFSALDRQPPQRAPRLGEHTAEALATNLGLSDRAIGDLIHRKVVATA